METSYGREDVKYVVLLKNEDLENAERRTGHETLEGARRSAAEFDAIVSRSELREQWLPQRIVKVRTRTVAHIEEVEGEHTG